MKTFFYYIFTGHWIKATMSVFRSKDAQELKSFEEDPCVELHCSVAPGISSKVLAKQLRPLIKGTTAHPLGINLGYKLGRDNAKDVIDLILETEGAVKVYLKKSTVLDLEIGRNWVPVGGLRFVKERGFWTEPSEGLTTGYDALVSILEESWTKIQQRKGAIPKMCFSCDEELVVTAEGTCEECGIDVDGLPPMPKSSYKLYKEIHTYEEETGKIVLDRVA